MATITTNGKTTPSVSKVTNDGYKSVYNFADEYAPDTMSEVAKIWDGTADMTGFLATFANEQGIASDLHYWAEETKFRVYETAVARATNVFTKANHNIRLNDVILVMDKAGNKTEQGIVTTIASNTFTASSYKGAAWTIGTSALTVIPIGSEFAKGTNGKEGSIKNRPDIYNTSLVIDKDSWQIPLSDVPRKTWLQAPDGKLFFTFSDENRAFGHFLSKLELKHIMGTKAESGSAAATAGFRGTEGLFQSIETKGSVASGSIGSVSDINDVTKHIEDVNGSIENVFFVTTDMANGIDDMLASLNKSYDAGTHWGSFDNGQKYLNLGFEGFTKGTYKYSYKTWKILKDAETFNPNNFGTDKINGIMMPIGMIGIPNGDNEAISGKTGTPIPYLTMLYKEGDGYSRKMETSYEGTGLPNVNTGNAPDYHKVNWRTERGLRAVGMLKWLMFKGA
jgi:hypothetical protein